MDEQVSKYLYPRDVAPILHGRLEVWRFGATPDDIVKMWNPSPTLAHTEEMLEVAFWSSFTQEEGRPTRISLLYQDPGNVHRTEWTTVSFENTEQFSVASLRRLSQAVDPSKSWIGIYPHDTGRLVIWGIVHPDRGQEVRQEPHGIQVLLVRPGFVVVRRELADILHYYLGAITHFYGPFSTHMEPPVATDVDARFGIQ